MSDKVGFLPPLPPWPPDHRPEADLERPLPRVHLSSIAPYPSLWKAKLPSDSHQLWLETPNGGKLDPPARQGKLGAELGATTTARLGAVRCFARHRGDGCQLRSRTARAREEACLLARPLAARQGWLPAAQALGARHDGCCSFLFLAPSLGTCNGG